MQGRSLRQPETRATNHVRGGGITFAKPRPAGCELASQHASSRRLRACLATRPWRGERATYHAVRPLDRQCPTFAKPQT